jgi:molecular chaperone DnaK
VDARNELDTVAYQVRRTLEDNAGAIPEHERARAELLLNEARTALEEQADIDRLRALNGEMHQLLQSLAASVRAGAVTGAGAGSSQGQRTEPGDDSDDVIDAEFTPR